MTNEQLAILLDSHLERLKAILKSIEIMLPEETEKALEWWHEEERISTGWKTQEELESEGCELRPTGEFLVLKDLKRFISSLQQDIHALTGARMQKRR